jgi:hypothetical protein
MYFQNYASDVVRAIQHATGLSRVIVHGVSALTYAVTERQNVLYVRDGITHVDLLDPVSKDEPRFLLQETQTDVAPSVYKITLNAQRIHIRVFFNQQPVTFVSRDKGRGFFAVNPQNACIQAILCGFAEKDGFYERAYRQYAAFVGAHPDSEFALYGPEPAPIHN